MQIYDAPAVLSGMDAQRFIGIDRDRVFYFAQQRQVVQRIAVKRAIGEALQRPAMSGEPVFQPYDLAFAKAWHIRHAAGKLTVLVFWLGGDQVLNAELAGDRRSNETV